LFIVRNLSGHPDEVFHVLPLFIQPVIICIEDKRLEILINLVYFPLLRIQENKSGASMQTIETKRCFILERKTEKLNTPAGFTKAKVV
jgi:hypothetical protein